jgi:trans-aconitate 2-methyltransferase
MTWNPELYLAFADHRLRPALDLMSRVPLEAPAQVVDLGCGAGNVTARLAARWPRARILGIDGAPSMLARARADFPAFEWREGDIGRWQAEAPVDLIFSNAALHWLDDHAALFPRLLGQLAKGGVLAVQMPLNPDAPWQQAIREVAAAAVWRARLAPLAARVPVREPGFYYRLLRPVAAGLDIWETRYLQVLAGEDPVLEWTRSTALRPYLDALAEAERPAFLAQYRERLRAAYQRESGGETLLPFHRLFIVARR